jgi:quercetin dioxygenase-like cupin family protein
LRKLVAGVDGAGRSCIVERDDLEPLPVPESPGFAAALIGATTSSPPPSRPRGVGPTNDLGVGPGIVTWMLVDYAPDLEFPVHNTDTIDFDTVIEGRISIVLDDGEHELEPGDVLVVNGVDHGWKAGPEGCRLSVLMVGTPPRP